MADRKGAMGISDKHMEGETEGQRPASFKGCKLVAVETKSKKINNSN